jgi:hypothetical protein
VIYAVKNNRGGFVYLGQVISPQGWIEFNWPKNVAGIQFQVTNLASVPSAQQAQRLPRDTDSIQKVFCQFRWQGGVLGTVPISHTNSYYGLPPGLAAMINFANARTANNAPPSDRVKIRVFAPIGLQFRLIAFDLVFE